MWRGYRLQNNEILWSEWGASGLEAPHLGALMMMSRRQEFIALPIHGLDEVSVQFMAQLVNDAGDPRPATVKRIRGGELIDLPL